MIKEYAIIDGNTIVNKILIDDSDIDTIAIHQVIPLPDNADIGWINVDGTWIDPNPQQEQTFELSPQEVDLILQELMNETST